MANPPSATYRLQVCRGLALVRVRELVGYLGHLGISHVHLPPPLAAVPDLFAYLPVALVQEIA